MLLNITYFCIITMEQSRPMDFTKHMVGKAVNVILKDGKTYRGKLKAFDTHTNIVLENCEEASQGKRRKLNVVFILGRNLGCCCLEDKNKLNLTD